MLLDKAEKIKRLNSNIEKCKRCPLYKSRKNPVFGEGSINSKVMFVGEAPGRNEDLEGRPFVGSAGKILDEILSENGIDRGNVYITNAVKCRPPSNRTPYKYEVDQCSIYLKEEIEIILPEIIVTLGRISGESVYSILGLTWHNLVFEREKIKEALYSNKKIKILSTYHPAAVIYNPELRKKLEDDIKKVKDIIEKEEPKGRNYRKTLDDFFNV
ncbi:MAG: uracil-DNA glycosylase family protein [Caldisphaera sp.]|jgi:DNA polymerase|nr:uracil-DNA glycosylase [Caldisphaera sp.]PMP61221.1 MAG: uracil-DNA glycosylase [Caldisphaera sp.]